MDTCVLMITATFEVPLVLATVMVSVMSAFIASIIAAIAVLSVLWAIAIVTILRSPVTVIGIVVRASMRPAMISNWF